MRPVVIDTSVALPAVLSPRGYRRRFWVLLALGALAARRDMARTEAEALEAQANSTGGDRGGMSIDDFVYEAEIRNRRLAALLPAECPDDWRLVASPPLLANAARLAVAFAPTDARR